MADRIPVVNKKSDILANSNIKDVVKTCFGPLTFYSFERVNWLPTHETYKFAILAATALERYVGSQRQRSVSVVDIGTGSGVIAITLAYKLRALIESGQMTLTASDISPDALAVAQLNAEENKLSKLISFRESDVLEQIDSPHVIVSNPPFSRTSELAAGWFHKIPYSTALALDGGEDGLDFYRRLFDQASMKLKPEGFMIVQCRENSVDRLMQEAMKRKAGNIKFLRTSTDKINAMVLGNKQIQSIFY